MCTELSKCRQSCCWSGTKLHALGPAFSWPRLLPQAHLGVSLRLWGEPALVHIQLCPYLFTVPQLCGLGHITSPLWASLTQSTSCELRLSVSSAGSLRGGGLHERSPNTFPELLLLRAIFASSPVSSTPTGSSLPSAMVGLDALSSA